MSQFDQRTVFYDVFISADGSRLVAIGPPYLNLQSHLGHLRLTINGRATEYRTTELPKGLVELQADLEGTEDGVFDVRISFEDFEWSQELAPCRTGKTCSLALTTIQRDNEIRWIQDWIKYYEDEIEVGQFFIYDNDSEYQQRLADSLPENVFIVPWNFPFGPTESHRNKFLQAGQLNHSRLRFEHVTTFLNFDIDELLVIRDENIRSLIRTSPCVAFEQYRVPYLDTGNPEYSYADFRLRKAQPSGRARKYSFNRGKTSGNFPHCAKFDRIAAKLFPWMFVKNARVSDAYFLHYAAITTDWKSRTSHNGGMRSRLTPYPRAHQLVRDEHIRAPTRREGAAAKVHLDDT